MPESALGLSWAYGVSTVKDGVVDLSDARSDRVFFVASHTAIIQDNREHTQHVLQGHTSAITCVRASEDTSLVVTADTGPDSMIIVWNTETAQPRVTIPQPHANGTLAMDLSLDGTLLVTLSKPEESDGLQEIALWDLSSPGTCTSTIRIPIPAGDVQTTARFNMSNSSEMMSNGKQRVYFWQSCLPATAALKYYSPPLLSTDFKQRIGAFTVSTFVPGSTQAITGTVDGDVVVWDEQGMSAEVGTKASDRKAVKLMRIHSSAVTVLSTMGDFIVSGGVDGYVRFFDPMLRLVAWFEHINAGEITAVSFSRAPMKLPDLETQDMDTFLCPDFVVGTRQSKIVALTAAVFNDPAVKRRTGRLLVEGLLTDIAHCCTHPMQASFLVVGSTGGMQVWDMVQHKLTQSLTLRAGLAPTCAAYSRMGDLVIVGTHSGALLVLNSHDLSEVTHAKHARTPITHIAISAKSRHIAAATSDGYVLLLFLVPFKHTLRWEYIGRRRVHYAPVVCVHFAEAPSGATRCFSVSRDGRLAEFNLDESSLATGVVMVSEATMCAGAEPTAMCFTPPLAYHEEGVIDMHMVLADSSMKMRVFNPDSGITSGTFRSPAYCGPLQQLVMFRSISSDSTFVAFRSEDRTAGILQWPMDGDPAKMMALLAHPGRILSVAVSFDGRKLITAGDDGVVSQWDVRTHVLEMASDSAEQSQDRWEQIVGAEEPLEDVRRFFMYAQIRACGEDTTLPRNVTGRLPLDHIPELMCALGYYPTQSEIHDMLSALAYTAAAQKQPKPQDIDFQTFLYLYFNFKQSAGVVMEEIEKAFVTLGGNRKTKALSSNRFVEVVTTLGEAMEVQELSEAIRLLTGHGSLEAALPQEMTPQHFASELLGFEAA